MGISGAPGVGKSELCKRIAAIVSTRTNLKVAISKEIARGLVKEGVKINKESESEDYLAFLTEHLKRLRTIRGDIMLFDRTCLDVFAFMQINGHMGGRLESLVDEIVKWQMTLFQLYIYIPPEIAVKADGVRITDPKVIKVFDEALLALLHRYRPDFVTVSGSLDKRIDEFLQQLAKMTNVVAFRNNLKW